MLIKYLPLLLVLLLFSCIDSTNDNDLDLEVTGIQVTPTQLVGRIVYRASSNIPDTLFSDSVIYYSYDLRNNGTGRIAYNESVPTKLTIGDTTMEGSLYSLFGVDSNTTYTAHGILPWAPLDTGIFGIRIEVNSFKKFNETNFQNNEKATFFRVRRNELNLIVENVVL